MHPDPESLHYVALTTNAREPLLAGEILRIAERAVDALPRRYPGLRVAASAFRPDAVFLLLDFSRCDSDVPRVVQSYKTEVRKLASQAGFTGEHFWQRAYEEGTVTDPEHGEDLKTGWNL